MNSLSFIVLFHVLTGIHGEGRGKNRFSGECILDFGVDTLFTCLHKQYHEEKYCIENVQMEFQRVMYTNLTDDCLVKHICTKSYKKNNNCSKEDCRKLLSLSIGSFNCDDGTSRNTKDENGSKKREENGGIIEREDDTKQDSQNSNDNIDDDNKERKRNRNAEGNYKNRDRKNFKKGIFKVGAIVGISVGITGTIIIFLVILAIIYVCRRRSKRKKRKKQRRQQSIDQRFEMKNFESGSSSTNKREYIVVSENKSLNTYEEQGQNYVTVLDSSITKYDKNFRNRKLPEIKRCSGAEGGENVYYEIDEDKILPEIKRFSVPQGDKRVYNEIDEDMEGVCQNEIEEFKDKYPYNDEQNIYETPRDQLIRQQSNDQIMEIAHLENSPSGVNKGDTVITSANEYLNTDEEQGEYFVLDPSVTKYDKDLNSRILPEVKRFSVTQCDEHVCNKIDEDRIESSPVIKVDQQKKIEDVKDIVIYSTDHINHGTHLGFDNTTYDVSSEVDDKSI
ncbi:putative histone-lysine N-methyltransferase 1 [Mytilus edulis]|uniref:putative histone-lysine N-methyltransferase 1 n=1 Tax=Mytilus edulis TaxID=6550 RepID=UPI0039F122D9